jgi:hypothetical protein
MPQEAAIGVAMAVIFAFLRWAIPAMPRPIAWSGVIAGLAVLVAAVAPIYMNLSLPVIALFLIGAICIGGAVHLALTPKVPVSAAAPAAGNTMGDIHGNTGIITQGQQGDNSIDRK